jgi:hypothetical protein
MKTFQEFMSLCEEVEDKSKLLGFKATIKKSQEGGRVRPKRKKTTPEIRRVKAVGGGKTEPVPYKDRKDIGQQRSSETRQQQPQQERGSADVKARAAAAAKEERKKAAQARAAAKKGGESAPAAKPKSKDLAKQASKLLSTKKPEASKPTPAKPRRQWKSETGGPMTRQERDTARNKEKTAAAQKTKKSSSEILAQMRREYEAGGGVWSNAVAVRMRAKAKAAAKASES